MKKRCDATCGRTSSEIFSLAAVASHGGAGTGPAPYMPEGNRNFQRELEEQLLVRFDVLILAINQRLGGRGGG